MADIGKEISIQATVNLSISEETAQRCIKILQMYMKDNNLNSLEIYDNRCVKNLNTLFTE